MCVLIVVYSRKNKLIFKTSKKSQNSKFKTQNDSIKE